MKGDESIDVEQNQLILPTSNIMIKRPIETDKAGGLIGGVTSQRKRHTEYVEGRYQL